MDPQCWSTLKTIQAIVTTPLQKKCKHGEQPSQSNTPPSVSLRCKGGRLVHQTTLLSIEILKPKQGGEGERRVWVAGITTSVTEAPEQYWKHSDGRAVNRSVLWNDNSYGPGRPQFLSLYPSRGFISTPVGGSYLPQEGGHLYTKTGVTWQSCSQRRPPRG